MVMGDVSCSKGRWFESQSSILDGHLNNFSHWYVVKIVLFFKRPKINGKEAGVGPFF